MVIKHASRKANAEDLSSIMAAHPDRWYFTKEQTRNTPSVRDGIDHTKEIGYRQQCANFIQDMGQRLIVNQLAINTAIVYLHRFYMFHSFKNFHRNVMAPCFLFLSAKVEEQPRKLEHVLKVAFHCLHKDTDAHLDITSNEYMQMTQELVDNESILLQTLGFEVSVEHPHTYVVRCTQLVKAHKELAQTAYFLATNSLHMTTFSVQYKPTVVACVCIYVACKWANYEIPSSQDKKSWWEYIDNTVTPGLIEELSSYFIKVLDNCPTRLKKKISAGPVIYKGGVLQPKHETDDKKESSSSSHQKESSSSSHQNGTTNDSSESKKVKHSSEASVSSKLSTSRPSDSRSSVSRPSDSRPSNSRPSDSRPSDSRPSDSRPSDSRQSDSRQSDSRQSDSRQSDSRQSDSRQSDSRQSDSRQSDSRQSDSRQSDSRPSDSRPSDSRPSDSRPSDSRPSDSRPSDSRPSDSRPSDSRPPTSKPPTSKPPTSERLLQGTDKVEPDQEKIDLQKSSRSSSQPGSKISFSDHMKQKERKEHASTALQKPVSKHSEHEKRHREHHKHAHGERREKSLLKLPESSPIKSSPLKTVRETDSKSSTTLPQSKLVDSSQNLSSVIEKASMSLPPLPLPLLLTQKHSLSDSALSSSPAKKQRLDSHKHSSKHKSSSHHSSHGTPTTEASKKEHRKHHEKHSKHSSSHHKLDKLKSPYKYPGSPAVNSPVAASRSMPKGSTPVPSSASSGEDQEPLPPPPPPPIFTDMPLMNTSSATVPSAMQFVPHPSPVKPMYRAAFPMQASPQMQLLQSSSHVQHSSPIQRQSTFSYHTPTHTGNTGYGLQVPPFQQQRQSTPPFQQQRQSAPSLLSNPAERTQTFGLNQIATPNFFASHTSNVSLLNKPPPPPPGAPALPALIGLSIPTAPKPIGLGIPTAPKSLDLLPPPPPPPPPGI